MNSQAGAGPPAEILLVEDDRNDQVFFCAAAAQTYPSLRIHIVEHGAAAIGFLEGAGHYANRTLYPWPDAVVLDLKLPVMDGFEFLAWRQRSPIFRVLPVVVISGSLNQGWEQEARKIGADRFFEKPLSLERWGAIAREVGRVASARTSLGGLPREGGGLPDGQSGSRNQT